VSVCGITIRDDVAGIGLAGVPVSEVLPYGIAVLSSSIRMSIAPSAEGRRRQGWQHYACYVGCHPQGCQVYSFKSPSAEDLDHDYLWRCMKCLPNRGHIGIFNRRYYEEVLVVRVHPYLEKQKIPPALRSKHIWKERFEDTCSFERYLGRNGIIVVKFFLHVSKNEQKRRRLKLFSELETRMRESRPVQKGQGGARRRQIYFAIRRPTAGFANAPHQDHPSGHSCPGTGSLSKFGPRSRSG
jgi:hypothetical protein